MGDLARRLVAESERLHDMAVQLSEERGKHHAYMFGEAAGLRRAANIIASLEHPKWREDPW